MIETNNLYYALDGGGSGCRALLWRDGAVLAEAESGPANLTSDFDGGIANLLDALTRAAEAAGVTLDAAIGHAGVAGVQSPAQAAQAQARLPGAARVTEDRDTAIAGALGPEGDGAVIAIGTGSFAGLRQDGAIRAIGGWGLQLSDRASGAWIGREALAATLEAVDGMRGMTPLAEALLARFEGTPQGIVGFAASARPADYAALAPGVVEAAGAGDALAQEIMARGAAWCRSALAALGHPAGAPVCLSGGLGPAYAGLLAREGFRIVAPKGRPLDGALILARARNEGEKA